MSAAHADLDHCFAHRRGNGADAAGFVVFARQEQGAFTPYGYLVRSGDEWQRMHEGQPVPEEYRVMGFPQPEVLREAVQTQQAAAPTAEAPAQPQVIPIILNSKNSADRMKEITDKLETGIMDLFESDRFQAYLDTMARFHNYSFNNTILIAMQGGQLVAGYNKCAESHPCTKQHRLFPLHHTDGKQRLSGLRENPHRRI